MSLPEAVLMLIKFKRVTQIGLLLLELILLKLKLFIVIINVTFNELLLLIMNYDNKTWYIFTDALLFLLAIKLLRKNINILSNTSRFKIKWYNQSKMKLRRKKKGFVTYW